MPQAAIPVQALGHVLGTEKTKTNFLGIYSTPPVPPRLAYYVVERRRLRSIHPFDEWSVSGGCCCGASSTFHWNVPFILHDPRVCVLVCVLCLLTILRPCNLHQKKPPPISNPVLCLPSLFLFPLVHHRHLVSVSLYAAKMNQQQQQNL